MTPTEKEEIRARTNIADLVGNYTALKPSGRKFKAICPFHSEKTPSFRVDPEAGTWRCFGACGEGGDVFSFLMKAENLSFVEAAERLAEKAGVKLTARNGTTEGGERYQQERERLWAVCALAQQFFVSTFRQNSTAQEYAAGRLLAPATLENFGIGYAPDSWDALALFLKQRNAHTEDAEKAGLIVASRRGDGSYTDRFRARLMFPIFDVQERIIGFGGRLIAPMENAPKYLNSPETPIFSKRRTLYGLNRARKAVQEADRIVVVEGYMDAVAAHQAGIAYVVATLGTSLTDEHVRLLRRYTKNVILSFDADTAGIRAAQRAVELFATVGDDFHLRVLSLPTGEDPDSLLRGGDPAPFLRAIDNASTVAEFRLRALESQYPLATDNDRVTYLREALKIVAEVPSAIEQDLLLRRLAVLHPSFASGGGHAEASLRDELNRLRPNSIVIPATGYLVNPVKAESIEPVVADIAIVTPKNGVQKAEFLLLRALLDAVFSGSVRERIAAVPFSASAKTFVDTILPLLCDGVSPMRALEQITDPKLSRVAQSVLAIAEDEPITPTLIDDCLRVLAHSQTRRVMREMEAAMGNGASNDVSDDDLRKWQQQMRSLKSDAMVDNTIAN